jgi:hypothetical protein
VAFVCFFLVIMSAAWMFATPVEETTIVTGPDGRVVTRESDTDYGPMVVPGIFFVASLACLFASFVAILKSRKLRGSS